MASLKSLSNIPSAQPASLLIAQLPLAVNSFHLPFHAARFLRPGPPGPGPPGPGPPGPVPPPPFVSL